TEAPAQEREQRTCGAGSARDLRARVIAMFTGIVNDLGEVIEVLKKDEELRRMSISCGYKPDSIDIGASIACSGICLTVVERGSAGRGSFFAVDTAAETLRMTTAGTWRAGTKLNLERALRLCDELGGH